MAKKILLLLVVGIVVVMSQTMVASDVLAEVNPVEGARFLEVTDVGGIAGSRFYLYLPSQMYNPYPMLTPVIYVYGDKPYQSIDDAWAALTAAGLDTIAEAEYGAVIMVNPVGERWGKLDVEVFEAIEGYIYFTAGTVKLTYHNLQYAIGEGTGATFINNYLSQHCKRIAAVMTFGGEIDRPYPLYALPAYIVSGTQRAVDFYLNVNDGNLLLPTSGRIDKIRADTKAQWVRSQSADKTTYTFKANPVKKVIVSNALAKTRLDAKLIADCWESLFRYTTRTCLISNPWQFSNDVWNDAEFTLAARPNYKKAGMQVIKQDGVGNGIWPSDAANYWYEFVPAAVQQAMAEKSATKFPLLLCLHGGGDHPIYEAESQGWAQLAIDNNIIMVAPNPTARGTTGVEEMMKLLDYMIGKYPVDTSRIYAAGFSGGARSTLAVSNTHPERFAAVAPMSCVSGPFYTDLVAALGKYNYDIDLPICVAGNGRETESTDYNEQYVWFDAIKEIYTVNEIPQYEGKLDYLKYPYWGFPLEDEQRFSVPTGFALWRGVQYDADGVPLFGAVHTEITTHTHYPEYAPVIWEYLKQFARNTETHKVMYTPAQ